MNRRSASAIIRILLGVATLTAVAFGATQVAHAQPDPVAATVTTTANAPIDTTPPIDTANPFFPEERNVTDCIGMLERPGCGSEERGGLHQNLVALIMAAALFLVFGRVGWSVWRSQQRGPDTPPPPDPGVPGST